MRKKPMNDNTVSLAEFEVLSITNLAKILYWFDIPQEEILAATLTTESLEIRKNNLVKLCVGVMDINMFPWPDDTSSKRKMEVFYILCMLILADKLDAILPEMTESTCKRVVTYLRKQVEEMYATS